MKTLALIACALLIAAQPAAAKAPPCTPALVPLPAAMEGLGYAQDGDTVTLMVDGKRVPDVRVFGIDAPELRSRSKEETTAGLQSRDALDRLLAAGEHRVRVEPIEYDKHCRIVARLFVGDRDLSEAMLRAGMAYVFTTWAFAKDRDPAIAQRYVAIERAARDAGVGLWPMWLGKP